MVFFSCDNCGESLKKNQVEKHTFRCRFATFSCIDCNETFDKISYSHHVKCITEDQKYGGKNYQGKEAKGEKKQNDWIEEVTTAIENVKEPGLRQLLQRIQTFGNIPRKETKFLNFLMNSVRVKDRGLCQRAWKAIAAETDKNKKKREEDADKQRKEKREEAGDTKSEEKEEAAEKQKEEKEEAGERQSEVTQKKETFKWKATIKRKLRDAGGQMKLKRLRAEVVEEWAETRKEACASEDSAALFLEKVAAAGIVIEGKIASLPPKKSARLI